MDSEFLDNDLLAANVLTYAEDECIRLSQYYLGTEEILFGLIKEKKGIASKALNYLGLSLKELDLEKWIGKSNTSYEKNERPTYTENAQLVLNLSSDIARQRGDKIIDTSHVLRGLAYASFEYESLKCRRQPFSGTILEEYFINLKMINQVLDYKIMGKELPEKDFDAINFMNRGIIKKTKKNYKGAISDFCKAMDLDPKYESSILYRGVNLKDSGNTLFLIEDYLLEIKYKEISVNKEPSLLEQFKGL